MNKRIIRFFALSFVLLCFIIPVVNGHYRDSTETKEELVKHQETFPGKKWQKMKDLKKNGWDPQALKEAQKYIYTLNVGGAVIIHKGKIVAEWGHAKEKYPIHSMRKSLISALYGPAVEKGKIKLSATMADLNIDDIPPALTDEEKTATVQMLLQARSGIYHHSAYTTAAMRKKQPARFSHRPGTFWYYNNWDFNTLGAIYNQEMGQDLYVSFKEVIADPIGMQYYVPKTDGKYVYAKKLSQYPAYTFKMATLDLARFGLLMAREGRWNGRQVIPAHWVKESTTPYSNAGVHRGYGYLWWVSPKDGHYRNDKDYPKGMFKAKGHLGHVIAVIPSEDLVMVYNNDDAAKGKTSYKEINALWKMVLKAKLK